MIAMNVDLLSALSQAGAIQTVPPGTPAAQNQRFDAALLQAAKMVQDGSGQGAQNENTLTPKVEQALESLLNQLSQQPEDQIRQLAKQPELLKPVVEALARAYSMDPEETKTLANAVPLVTQGLTQAMDGGKAVAEKTIEIAAPGKISGPQGGEPGTTVDPAKTLKPEPIKERSTEDPTTMAPAMVWAPALVSTRTDGGSGADSQVSLASRPVEAPSAPANVQPVVTVNVSSPAPAQGANASVAEPNAPAALAPAQPQTAVTFTGISAQPQTAAKNVQDPIQAPEAQEAPASAPAPREAVQGNNEQPVAATSRQAAPQAEAQAPTSSPAPAGPAVKSSDEQLLDFKVASPSTAPIAVKEGTLFLLNGDGSTQGARQVAAAQPPVGAALPSASGPQAAVPQQVQAAVAQLPVAASVDGSATTPLATVSPAPVRAEVTAPTVVAGVPAQQAPTQTEAPQITAPALAQAPATRVPQTTVIASDTRPVSESSPVTPKTAATASSEAPFEPQALESSAGFQALARTGTQEDAPQTGLGFGQDTLRQVLNQVARELGVREAAFTQVSDALAASGKENSRLLIKLKPASLGEVQVDLSVVGGKLTARLIASTAEVRDAFVRDLPAFKANLETQGIKIDQVSVAVRSGNDFNPQGQGQPQPQGFWQPQTPTAENSYSAPVTQAVWAAPAANDQLFSALA